ncbi:MAG: GH116 family glycosyl-hydrolase, partial [Armatimonadota bacterium]
MSDRQNVNCSPDDFKQWAEAVMQPADRLVYSGDSLRAVTMPMGGIGTGNFALAGDGTLRQWQIFNQVNHTAFLPGTFFGVGVLGGPRGNEPMMRLLQTDCFYDADFEPALSTSDHVIPDEARRMAERVETVDGIEFVGEYPIAEVAYIDE